MVRPPGVPARRAAAPSGTAAVGRRVGLDRDRADHHRVLGPVPELVVAPHGPFEYLSRHVKALRDLAEDGPVAVHPRGLAEGNVELAGGGFHLLGVPGADGPLLVNDLVAQLRLEPVADAA